ncbi:extracellular solute-binding protein [Paenibacillus sp. GYB004]|uniref:ABC transporter substrate-binding protein n=1 Tax=Paenibacillus sp. GYB004 TaxID=2994393 RepID=UPI002F965C82
MKTFHTVAIALSLGVLGLTGCSSGGGAGFGKAGKPAPGKDPDPFTLKLFTHQPMTADDFRLLIAEPVKKKYPYITVELLEHNATMLENAVASKEQIDLITIWNGNMNPNKGLGLFEDITPLAKSEQFDLTRFEPDALKTLRTLGDNGELYGLPYNMQFNALYYNKDLFDKFGAAYPQDGMTWDDVVQLAKRLTRIDGGIQYSGLGMDSWTRPVYPLSLIPVDAKTNAAAVNSEPYRKAFTLGKMIYSIPGNAPNFSTNEFIKERSKRCWPASTCSTCCPRRKG